MQTYQVHCPLCEDSVPVKIEDYQVIYYIEAFTSNPRQLFSWSEPDPDGTVGRELLVSLDWVTNVDQSCKNDHHLVVYSCHYEHVDRKRDRLYGPSK